jgi:hypothetical protein
LNRWTRHLVQIQERHLQQQREYHRSSPSKRVLHGYQPTIDAA